MAIPLLVLLADATAAVIGYRLLGGPSVTLLQAIYMAVVTLTGVGYTEVVDTSANPPLRIFNMFIMVVGVATAVYVFSLMTAFLVEGELHAIFRRSRMHKKVTELRDHFILCGMGETGRYAAEEMMKTGTDFVAIEISEPVVSRLREQGGVYSDMLYIIGDSTEESVLNAAGLEHARGLIACVASDKDNLVTTFLVRQQNPAIRIVSRYKEVGFAERMVKAGANATVSPNQIGGMRLASEVLRPQVVGFLDLMLQEKSRTLRVDEIEVGERSRWAGSAIAKLQLRERFHLVVLALKDADQGTKSVQFNPGDETIVSAGTVIIVMGDIADLHKARAEAGPAGL